MRFYESAPTLIAEQDQFDQDMKDFVEGRIDPVKFKGIRVEHGVYEQRKLDTYMIRIRCAGNGITPEQLKKVAELGEKYGSSEVHFTTRNEVQVHEVLIQNVIKVIRGLNEVGLSSRGGGGNTVRNILTSVDSGISKTEIFDVQPYAVALTTRMINEEDSWNLPRKLKISFSNGPDDSSYTQATCLGFVAKIQNGQKGFEVYTAGGMGAKPMVGHQLFDFVPEDKVYHVTRAIKVMFDKHGNRRSKFSSRIKFLYKKQEKEGFEALFFEEYDKIKEDTSLALQLPVMENKAAENIELQPEIVDTPAFHTWKQRYCFNQKQEGLVAIKLPLILGDLSSADAYKLCDFLKPFGNNVLRCIRAQNIQIRNIPEQYLGNLYNVLIRLEHTLMSVAPFIGNMINCTGAQTCKLGICLPRGLSQAIRERLISSDLDLDAITQFRLNMSGCPNTCGMHHIANLGFFGKVGRKNGDMYPMYNVLAGAKTGAGQTEYAKRVSEIAAHCIPDFVYDFLKIWIELKKQDKYATYNEFLDAEGFELIKTLCEKYKDVPDYADDPTIYTDFGAKRRLSLDEIGTAECSAGVFDMIDVDKKTIKNELKNLDASETDLTGSLSKILRASSRMLLVTRGLDAKNEKQIYSLFKKHFLQTGLISDEFINVVEIGEKEDTEALVAQKDQIVALSTAVNDLYKNMDDSLRFKNEKGEVIVLKPVKDQDEEVAVTQLLEKDFRGVACPMNFVQTKLVLETIQSGALLKILLDDGEPIQNVPNSVELEGHKVLDKQQHGNYWEVLIKKA